MRNYYKTTKHPQTGNFDNAAWLDFGKFYYVAFPDGRWYHEKYCVWEFQEVARIEEDPPPLQKIANLETENMIEPHDFEPPDVTRCVRCGASELDHIGSVSVG